MIIWVHFARNMDSPSPSYVKMMPTNHSRDGQWKKKSHAIISLIFFSVLVVLSLVSHKDVEYISRWSFECNLQEIWTHLRRHMSEWCLRVTSERWAMEEKIPCDHFLVFFSVLATLSLVRHRDVEYISRWLFECNLQEIWTYYRRHMSKWCLRVLLQRWAMEEKIPCDHFLVYFSLFLWYYLSLGHRDVEYISRWSFECKLQEIWTYYRRHM